MGTIKYDNKSGIIGSAHKYVELGRSSDGTSFNPNNFIYHLPRTVNQLTRIIGNDIVLKGMGNSATAYPDENKIIFTIEPGVFLADNTLVESPDLVELTVNNAGSYDTDGVFVVVVNFQYLQTLTDNKVRFEIKHISQQGISHDGWDKNKHRIILGSYRFTTSDNLIIKGTGQSFRFIRNDTIVYTSPDMLDEFNVGDKIYSVTDLPRNHRTIVNKDYINNYLVLSDKYLGSDDTWNIKDTNVIKFIPDSIETLDREDNVSINIYNKQYYEYGYDIDNVTLFRYIEYFSRFVGGSQDGLLIVPEDLTIGDDLVVNDQLSVGGTSSFHGDMVVNEDLLVSGTITTNQSLEVQGDEFKFNGNYITVNSGEQGDRITDGSAGIILDRGSSPSAKFWFDETTDKFFVGIEGQSAIEITAPDTSPLENLTNTDITNWFSAFEAGFNNHWGGKTSDNLPEGLSNLYYSENRFFNSLNNTLKAGDNIGFSLDTENNITISNTYTHPGTHPADMIIQDTSHRFVTDDQKNMWNAKLDDVPIASDSILGGIKVGNNLSIDPDGTLHASGSQGQPSSFLSFEGGNARSVYEKIIDLDGGNARSVYDDGSRKFDEGDASSTIY